LRHVHLRSEDSPSAHLRVRIKQERVRVQNFISHSRFEMWSFGCIEGSAPCFVCISSICTWHAYIPPTALWLKPPIRKKIGVTELLTGVIIVIEALAKIITTRQRIFAAVIRFPLTMQPLAAQLKCRCKTTLITAISHSDI